LKTFSGENIGFSEMILRILLGSLLMADPQVLCTLGPETASYNAYSDERPTPDALELAGKVNQALVSSCRPNCPTIAMFRNTTAPNAMLMKSPGQAKFAYKPEFFTTVYERSGDAGILAIVAHEVGHAIDGALPVSWIKKDWSAELRADAWAGCALGRMNLTARALQAGLSTLAQYPSRSHPNWETRLPVVRMGYVECGGDPKKL
jgi:hypothetical protein